MDSFSKSQVTSVITWSVQDTQRAVGAGTMHGVGTDLTLYVLNFSEGA